MQKNSNNRSLDGFLSSEPRRPKFAHSKKNTPQSDISANSPNKLRQGRLDDFNKPEGFRRQNPTGASSNSSYQSFSEPSKPDQPINSQNVRTTYRPPSVITRRSSSNNIKKKRISKKKAIFRTLAFTVIAAMLVTGWIFGKAWWNANKALSGGGDAVAFSKEIDPNSLTGEGDGRVNIMLTGKGGETHEGGELTDSIMIASIDPINNGVVLVSLPRDMWVKPKDLWPMKINAVYSSAKSQALYKNPKDTKAAEKAGIDTLEKTVEDYTGVKINYYGMIDFTAFQEAVNTIGGIDVTLEEPYTDPTMYIGRKLLSLPAGTTHLDGATALGYARSRYGAERGDFDRGEHQQKVIVGIKDKVLSLGTFSNPLKVSQLLDTMGNRVETNFALNDIMRLYELSKQIQTQNIKNVDLAMEGEAVVTTDRIGDQSVVIPKAGVDDYSEVKQYIRSKLIDGFIIKEQPTVIVLNGSNRPGAAKKRADELKSYGYNVLQVADAENSELTATTLVDKTNGVKKYTKRYLELRFNTKAVKDVKSMDLTPYTADFIVVIGPNG
jgi:LCP family protein required for cell wall assembly